MLTLSFSALGHPSDESIEKLIRHADTTYCWDSRKRGCASINRGLSALDRAEVLCRKPIKRKHPFRHELMAYEPTSSNRKKWLMIPGYFLFSASLFLTKITWNGLTTRKLCQPCSGNGRIKRDTLIENLRNLPQMMWLMLPLNRWKAQRCSYTLENETHTWLMKARNSLTIMPWKLPRHWHRNRPILLRRRNEPGDRGYFVWYFLHIEIDRLPDWGGDHFWKWLLLCAKAAPWKRQGNRQNRTFVYGFTRDVTERIRGFSCQ